MKKLLLIATVLLAIPALGQTAQYTVVKAMAGYLCIDHKPCGPRGAIRDFTGSNGESLMNYVAATYVVVGEHSILHAAFDHIIYSGSTRNDAGTDLSRVPVGVPVEMARKIDGLCWQRSPGIEEFFSVYSEEERTK
jgi:hypothetical protein